MTIINFVQCSPIKPKLRIFAVTGEALESRYRALDLEPIMTEDCYLATLELTKTTKEDQRLYRLIVENDRGSDRRALMLRVDEPGQVNYTEGQTSNAIFFIDKIFFFRTLLNVLHKEK